jgi:hypothetical protein
MAEAGPSPIPSLELAEKIILFHCIFNIQLMVILGLANDKGTSYLSRLCKLAPIQVQIIM